MRDDGNLELFEARAGFIDYTSNGSSASCPMSAMTLKMGIERILKQEIPEVKEIVAV